jgi:ParB family chromosome partitioning protein
LSSRRRLSRSLTDAFTGTVPPGLGGSSALFENAPATGHFRRIPIDRLRPCAERPRRSLDPDALDELAASIRAHGVLQPIRVRSCGGGRYEIVAGERRWIAARQAGLREIPALIAASDDQHAYVESLVENIQREDLNAVDRAQALRHLRVNLGLPSWEEVGRVVGITRQHVYNLLRITQLPTPMLDDLRTGALTEKHARALLLLRNDPAAQNQLWEHIHDEVLSGDAALDAAQRTRASTASAVARREVRTDSARGSHHIQHAAPDDDDADDADVTLDEHDVPPVVSLVLDQRSAAGARRVTDAVDTLLAVIAGATPDELLAARPRLDILQVRLDAILTPSPTPHEQKPSAPLRHLTAGDDAGGDRWGSVLIPAAGHSAG